MLSDFIFGIRDSKKAILAGQDLEMPFRLHFDRDLPRLVAEAKYPWRGSTMRRCALSASNSVSNTTPVPE